MDTFHAVAAQLGVDASAVTLSSSTRARAFPFAGKALFCTRPTPAGTTLLRISRERCLISDAGGGSLSVPDAAGEWPLVCRFIDEFEFELPWYILQALALVDAVQGQGCPSLAAYAASLLPPVGGLSCPMTLRPEQLVQFQHLELIQGARAQQERLSSLFPGRYILSS